jgi:hypothetical protein
MTDTTQTRDPGDGPDSPSGVGRRRPDQGDGVQTPAETKQDPATGGEGAAGAGGSGGFGT